MNTTSASELMTCLLDREDAVPLEPRPRYLDHVFEVPPDAKRIVARVSFNEPLLMYLSLHDPAGFRGNRMNPGAKGAIELELWVATDAACEGGTAGVIPAGSWTARLNVRRLSDDPRYRLQIFAEIGTVAPVPMQRFPENHVVDPSPGWYKGELHAHSSESDGKAPVATVVRAALDVDLDFLSLTDHYTFSHWAKLAPLTTERLALLRSIELTDIHGHANLQGIREWVDVYVGRDGWHMNDAADATHRQGGLFCVNHAFSGYLGWRTDDFDWDKADLLEVYHNLEGPNNHALLPLWDHHLRLGRRIVGVGGVDSHDPYEGRHALGQVVTWIEADELSERGLIAGLRRGRVYVSRGPQLRFEASNHSDQTVQMWEQLAHVGEPVTLQVRVNTDQPLHLFVFRNGYPWEQATVDAASERWQAFEFRETAPTNAYYRVELHAVVVDERLPGLRWRDWSTTQAISNPIFVQQVQARVSRQRSWNHKKASVYGIVLGPVGVV